MGSPIGVESWIWYSFVILVVVARYTSRFLLLGSVRKFSYEDYIMLIIVGTYTVLIALLNVVIHMSTNLIEPDDIPSLTAADIAERTQGSKLVIVAEQMMCATIWLCKACLLLMYYKMTFGLRANIACKIVGGYVAINFVVMEILYFGVWCRPFSNAWITPTPNQQCATQTHHLITNLVFNLTSDIFILAIPLPLLIKSHLPARHKVVLVILFSLGAFVMLSAILSKVSSFRDPFSSEWVFWYTREASTAVIVTNMPHCWSLVRRVFHLRSFIANGSSSRRVTSDRTRSYGPRSNNKSRNDTKSSHRINLRRLKSVHSPTESQEGIATSKNDNVAVGSMEIWQDVHFEVSHSGPRSPTPTRTADNRFGKGHAFFDDRELGTKSNAIALKEVKPGHSSSESLSEASSSDKNSSSSRQHSNDIITSSSSHENRSA